MQQHALGTTNFGNFSQRLDHAGLVVRRHDRNQSRLRPNGGGKLIKIDHPISRNIQPRHFKTFVFLQMLDRVEHGVMFSLVRNDMTPARRSTPRQSEHGQIVRFRSAACENQFMRLCVQERGQFIARIIDRCACLSSGRVDARWISKMAL